MTAGHLLLRDAEEPAALATPTTVAGTQDTEGGALSGVSLAAAPVAYQTEALGQQIDVTAVFSEVAPGTGVGAVDADGNVFLQTTLTADLHLEIGVPPFITTDCRMTPIELVLDSTAPYDPETQTVTLADTGFTLPEAQTAGCHPSVIGSLNDLLAGPGHAITLTLTGALVIPPPPPPPAVASLTADPLDGSTVGEEVTLRAEITPGPDAATGAVPTGFVDFRDGTTVLATTLLDPDGTAELTTTALPAGPRRLTVSYRGDGNHGPDTSDPLTYHVAARPVLAVELPTSARAGSPDPIPMTVTVSQTGFGTTVEDARIDLTFRRPSGSLIGVNLVVERQVGAGWVPVPLAPGDSSLASLIGTGAPAADLPASGPPRTEVFRITLPANVGLGPLTVTAEVVPESGGTPAPVVAPAPAAVASSVGSVAVHDAGRIPTTLLMGTIFPAITSVARPGYDVFVQGTITPSPARGISPTGTVDVRVGDRVVATVSAGSGDIGAEFPLPTDVAPGLHDVYVRYNGDAHFGPSEAVVQIRVHPPIAPVYACHTPVLGVDQVVHMQIEANALLPSAAPPGPVGLGHLDVEMSMSRSVGGPTTQLEGAYGYDTWWEPGDEMGAGDTLEGIELGFGPGGTGTAGAVRFNGFGLYYPDFAEAPDMGFQFDGESATVEIAGAPGEVVPVTLDEIVLRTRLSVENVPFVTTCTPVGDPVELGEVTVAGTTLTVDAPSPTRVEDEVTVTANVAPSSASGVVEFLDGAETVGVVPAIGGVARTTLTLPEGNRSLRARFHAQVGGPSSASEAVPLVVLPAVDCGSFVEEGNGAVVRLVYMELLGRCPDEAGFDHWVGRLDAGTSPEAFARSIARTSEAVGRVVDDAYETMLGRAPDAEGRVFWTQRLRASGRYDQLLADLGGSGELWSKAGSTRVGFVTRVYERLLGRAPDAGGLDHWVGRLESGTSRQALVRTLATLEEPLGRIVAASYDEILGRTPSPAEKVTAIGSLRSTGDRSGLYARLIGTDEFTTRAQGFPNPED